MKTLQKTSTGEVKAGKKKVGKTYFNREFMLKTYSKMSLTELIEREAELIFKTKNDEFKPELYQELLGICREVIAIKQTKEVA